MSLTDDIIKTEVERHVQLYNIEQLKRRLFNCFKDYTNQYVDAGRLLLYSDSLSRANQLGEIIAEEVLKSYTDLETFYPDIRKELKNLPSLADQPKNFKQKAALICDDFMSYCARNSRSIAEDSINYGKELLRKHDPFLLPYIVKEKEDYSVEEYINSCLQAADKRYVCEQFPINYERKETLCYGNIYVTADIPQMINWQIEGKSSYFHLSIVDQAKAEFILTEMLLHFVPGKLHITGVDLNFTSAFENFKQLDDVMVGETILQLGDLLKQIQGWNSEIEKRFREAGDIIKYHLRKKRIEYPYEVIVLYDLPQQLDSHLTEAMKSIIRNGWRVGFHIIVVGNLPSQWEKELFVETDGPKMSAVANTPIGTASKRIEILKKWQQCYQNFQKELSQQQEREAELQKQQIQETMTVTPYQDAAKEFSIEVGTNNQGRINFVLDEISHVHSFIIGQTGSGKSVFLHDILNHAMLKYSPESLQFYLMDFKFGGVEFNRYRTCKHVRCLMVDESDPQITLEILKDLWEVMQERARLMRNEEVSNLKDYNAITSNKKLPRIVLLVDECHELFKEGRFKIQSEIDVILTRIAKEGRNQGVHLIFATQTLTGTNIPGGIKNNITDPYLLNCRMTDAQVFIPTVGTRTEALSTGEVYYRPKGFEEGIIFKADFYDRERLVENLQNINQKSTNCIVDFQPFYFSGKQTYRLVDWIPDELPRRYPAVYLGRGISVKSNLVSVSFKPETASNLLLVGINERLQSTRIQLNILLSLIHYYKKMGEDARFYLIDCMDPDDEYAVDEEVLNTLEDYGCHILVRNRQRNEVLSQLAIQIRERKEKEDTFLFILEQDYFTSLKHNAEVELPVEDHSPVSTPANQNANDFLSDCPFPFTAESVMENPAKSKNKVDTVQHILQTVLTKGPDYGIHTILQVNKLDNLLFQEYSLNKKDIYSMFQYVVVQRTDSETAIKLALSDDFKPEQMSDDHERLRSYFRNDITGAEILYCPFDSITVNDIKNLMK